jgi:hypothetical protein
MGVPGSRSKREKMTPQKLKKDNKFQFLKCWMFSFEGLRLLLYSSLDALYGSQYNF